MQWLMWDEVADACCKFGGVSGADRIRNVFGQEYYRVLLIPSVSGVPDYDGDK